ncbi:collagen-like protein [Cohnella sp. WQ 127256]|uniref:collagen-like protein n=1 Tax=Cohnella sp. WQ 127256 TaxID=2938790 RepID=UPI0021188C0B
MCHPKEKKKKRRLRVIKKIVCKKCPPPNGRQLLRGLAGAIAEAGPEGLAGALGPQGAAGLVGAIGALGPEGLAGALGPQGAAGLVGAIGALGPEGLAGALGPQGLAGLAGAIGAIGPQGLAGALGPQGLAGLAGAIGTAGLAGPAGPAGPAGTQGAAGPAGPAGTQGEQGPTGSQGPAGAGGLIPFSTGIILSGATVVSAAPILMGFGNHTVEVIDGSGESTMPPEAGGFAFPIPFAGTVQNLQISVDLLVASVVSINTLGLQYDFTVFRAPSVPNNGIDHSSSPYVTTPLTSSVRFGFPNTDITPGVPSGFRTATNINLGSLVVAAGDRIGIRVRTLMSTDPSAADITQLSFSASLSYTPF